MSDFYFVYVDDYGDSSNDLSDPKQPIFSLTAAFVKAEHWMSLEMELLGIIERFQTEHGISLERLHAVEIYQRSGGFRKLSTGIMLDLFEEILKIIASHEVKFVSALSEKQKLKEFLANAIESRKQNDAKVNTNYLETLLQDGKFMLPAYVHGFAEMMSAVDLALEKLNAYGILIVDQQEQFRKYESTPIHKILRASNSISRILENPIYRDSRVQVLLCIPDFLGYVVGGVIHDEYSRKGKERPKLKEWLGSIVKPMQIDVNRTGLPEQSLIKHGLIHDAFSMEEMFQRKNTLGVIPISRIRNTEKNE